MRRKRKKKENGELKGTPEKLPTLFFFIEDLPVGAPLHGHLTSDLSNTIRFANTFFI